MSSQLEDLQALRPRYYGVEFGTVTDNKDPLGLHRVRVNVPGIAEPETDWLWPFTAGGGSPKRGGHIVPDVGADVGVFWHAGDIHGRGGYLCAHWGKPRSGSEMPSDANDAVSANPEQVQSLELNGLRITVDERAGKRMLQVLDVAEDGSVACAIVLDRETRSIELQAVTGIIIRSDGFIALEALEVQVNGRRVAPTGGQIG